MTLEQEVQALENNPDASLDDIAKHITNILRYTFKNKTGDDDAFIRAFIIPRVGSDYVHISALGLHDKKMIGNSVDVPKRLVTPEEQLYIANVIRDKQVQLAEELFVGAV